MMHDFAKKSKKKRRIVQHDTAFYGLEGSRTLDLSDANRTLSQLSYEPIFKPPKTAWGRVVYNSRLFKGRMGSQLSYEPIFKPPKTAWGRVVYNSRLFKDRMGSQQSRFCAHLAHREKRKINVYSSIQNVLPSQRSFRAASIASKSLIFRMKQFRA